MAPKKANGKKAETKTLERPKVSEAEVADAKNILEDKDAKRRANSNMMYWLKTQNKRDAYDEATPAERNNLPTTGLPGRSIKALPKKHQSAQLATRRRKRTLADGGPNTRSLRHMARTKDKHKSTCTTKMPRNTGQTVTKDWMASGIGNITYWKMKRRISTMMARNMT